MSKTINQRCLSRLSCEMSTRREYPREESSLSVMISPEDIALKNQRLFFILYITCQGCSPESGQQLRQTDTQTLRLSMHRYGTNCFPCDNVLTYQTASYQFPVSDLIDCTLLHKLARLSITQLAESYINCLILMLHAKKIDYFASRKSK